MKKQTVKRMIAAAAAVAVTISQAPYGTYAQEEGMPKNDIVVEESVPDNVKGTDLSENQEKEKEKILAPGFYLSDGKEGLAEKELVEESLEKGYLVIMRGEEKLTPSVNEDGGIVIEDANDEEEFTFSISGGGLRETEGSFSYSTTEAVETGLVLAEKSDAGIKADGITLAYGDEVTLADYVTKDTKAELTFSFKEGDAAVLEDGVLTVTGEGEVSILVTAEETKDHFAGEALLKVTCVKKSLGALSAEDISFQEGALTRTYDGQDSFTADGTVATGLSDLPEARVRVTLTMDAPDAGERTTNITGIALTDGAEKICTASIAENAEGPAVTVLPFPVTVSATEQAVTYGSDVWKKISEAMTPDHAESLFTINEETPDEAGKVLSQVLQDGTLAPFVSVSPFVGVYKGALTASIAGDGVSGNYKVTHIAPADIIVLSELTPDDSALYARITPHSASAYMDGDALYMRPGSAITYRVNDGEPYDTVTFEDAGADNTLAIPENSIDGPFMPAFFLSASKDTTGKTRTMRSENEDMNAVPEGRIIVDGTGPEISFGEIGTARHKSPFSWIGSIFNRNEVSVSLAADDQGSGVASFRYKAVLVNSDEEADAAFEAAEKEDRSLWKTVPENGTVSLNEPSRGFWIILAEAVDHAGNGSLASSRGIVIETAPPVLSVEGIEDGGVYHDDISYTITVADDMTKAYSGISKISATLVVNGKEIPANNNGTFTDSFSVSGRELDAMLTEGGETVSGNSVSGNSADELSVAKITRAAEGLTLSARISKETAGSNDAALRVSVQDLAGNTTSYEARFILDATAPSIEAVFSGAEAVNETYFKDTRTLEVRVTERNFDPANAQITLGVDGHESVCDLTNFGDAETVTFISVEDPNAEADKKTLTDERTAVYRYLIGDGDGIDHDYTLDVCYNAPEGSASAELSSCDRAFTIDKKAPVLSGVFKDAAGAVFIPASGEEEMPFSRRNITASISVAERNFDPDRSTIDATAGAVYADGTYTAEFTEEGEHRIRLTVCDLAGNETVYEEVRFGIDKTAPQGSIKEKGSENIFTKLITAVTNFLFRQGATGFVLDDVSDNLSGIKRTDYYIDDITDGNRILTAGELAGKNWTAWEDVVTIDAGSTAVLYARLTDKAGNTAYISTDGIVAEGEDGAIRISFDVEASAAGVDTNDIPFRFTVTDGAEDGAYAGLASVSWYVTADGNVTQKAEENETVFDPNERVKTFNGNGVIKASENESNDIEVFIVAVDNAGERVVDSFGGLRIDTTKPRVVIEYNTSDAKNETFYNTERNVSVSVMDENPAEDGLRFVITAGETNGTYTVDDIRNSAVPGVTCSGSGSTYANLVFGAASDTDLDFAIRAYAIDRAGNVGDISDGGHFTVDKVAPVIENSLKGGLSGKTMTTSAENDPLYDRSSVTADYVVTERNFVRDGHSAVITTETSAWDVSGNKIRDIADNRTIEDVSTWTSRSDKMHGTTGAFAAEANYKTRLTVEDLAGNTASTDDMYFTVDRTAPKAVLRDEKDGNIFEKLANVIRGYIFSDTDIRFTVSNATDAVSGVKSIGFLTDNSETVLKDSGLAKAAFAPYENEIRIPADSQAVVYVAVEDKAGNIAYINSHKLAVADKTAPAAPVVTFDKDPDADGYYTADVPFTVTVEDPETNGTYSGIESVVWHVTADGRKTQSYDGTADASVLTDPYTRNRTWTVKGTINAALNDANKVVVTAEARDRADNTVSAVSAPIKVDVTAPQVRITYDNNKARYNRYFNSGRTMTINVDEKNMKEEGLLLDLTIDGTRGTYSVADIREGRAAGLTYGGMTVTERDGKKTTAFRIGFGLDGKTDHDYTARVTAKDAAGNRSIGAEYADGTEAADYFTIDEVKPSVSVVYNGGASGPMTPGTDISSPVYDRQGVVVIATVRERNFRTDGVSADCTIRVSQRDSAGTSEGSYYLYNRGEADTYAWGGADGVYAGTLGSFMDDSNYGLSFEITDLAGNTVTYAPHYFSVDKTAPTGEILLDDGTTSGHFNGLSSIIRFLFFRNSAITARQTSSDATSGIASVSYYLWEPGPESRGEFAGLTQEDLAGVTWTPWSGELAVGPDTGAVVYMRLVDRAGNIAYVGSQGGMIADATAPGTPTIDILTAAPAGGIYNSDVTVRIHAEDVEAGGTYAGLSDVSYRILSGGNVTQSGSFASELADSRARVHAMDKDIMIEAARNNSNHVTVEVTARDYAGNVRTAARELSIDATAPVIEISYSRPEINGTYNNSAVTATIRVTERNFDPASFALTVNEERGASAVIGGWSLAPDMGESDSAVSTCTVTFDKEGAYAMTASCSDRAGNRTQYGKTDRFVVDLTAPTLAVSYETPDAVTEGYYNKPVKATVTVHDRFLDESGFGAAISAALDGNVIEAPSFGAFARNGDTMTASVIFANDGDYRLNLSMTDRAGNRALSYTGPAFTIDMTPPVITVSGIKDREAVNGDKVPVFTFSDRNILENGFMAETAGTRHEAAEASGTYEPGTNGGTFTLTPFAKTADADDIYTVRAAVMDKAGNTSAAGVTFSINRFGSVYTYGSEARLILDNGCTKEASDFTIYETNTDSLVAKGITVSRDGELLTLKEGTDYTITESGGEGEWKVYAYKIDKSVFEKEGLYEIRINSEDAAGNRQDNQLKDEPAAFVVDRTAPLIAFSGITDNGRYEENEHSFIVTAADNFAFGEVRVTIDGKETVYTAEDIAGYEGRIPVVVKSADDWQTIELTAVDAAGNAAQKKTVRVLVTTNRLLQFMANKPLFFGTCGGATGLAGLLIFLLLKKKKKEEEGHTTDELKHTDGLGKTTDELDKK